MAIFDEYKQAVQDVLDGNTKEPPRPSAFPDEQDMLAALYAAAAALFLSKEAPGGGGGGAIIVNKRLRGQSKSGDTKGGAQEPEYELDKTAGELWTAVQSGAMIYVRDTNEEGIEEYNPVSQFVHFTGDDVQVAYLFVCIGIWEFTANSADEYPVLT